MFGQIVGDDLHPIALAHGDGGHLAALGKDIAGQSGDEDLGAGARFLLDRGLNPGEGDELLARYERKQLELAPGLDRAARGEAQGGAGLGRFVHDHQIGSHFPRPLRIFVPIWQK
jgi:hypothetical protein